MLAVARRVVNVDSRPPGILMRILSVLDLQGDHLTLGLLDIVHVHNPLETVHVVDEGRLNVLRSRGGRPRNLLARARIVHAASRHRFRVQARAGERIPP